MNKKHIIEKNENNKPEEKKFDMFGGKSVHEMLNLIHKPDTESDSNDNDDDDDDDKSDDKSDSS